jgi:probable phosphoglycerate mutase
MPHARLFADPDGRAERPADVSTAYIDGASRGNPGPASYAVILKGPDGKVLLEHGKYFGRATNNVAEYYALISALDGAASRGITRLRVRSDSELLVRQMEGRYKVKSGDLKPLFERAQKLVSGFAWFTIEYVSREENREADRLANQALDRTGKPSSQCTASVIRESKAETQRMRARYLNGALIPSQPLELPDGTEVEITIHKEPRS